VPKGQICYDESVCDVDKPCNQCCTYYHGREDRELEAMSKALTEVMEYRKEQETTKSYSIFVPVKVPSDFIEDVLVTVIEGGIQYWAGIIVPQGYPDTMPVSTKAYCELTKDGGEVGNVRFYDVEDNTEFVLTLNKLLRGISLYFEKYGVELDASNIDANAADSIIQYALFGEQVYG